MRGNECPTHGLKIETFKIKQVELTQGDKGI